MEILVVVPDVAVRAAVLAEVDGGGYEVRIAAGYPQAILELDARRTDVAIVDESLLVSFPELGAELVRRPAVHVIMLRCSWGDLDPRVPLPLGVDDLLQRPFTPGQLRLRVQVHEQRRAGTVPGVVEDRPLRMDASSRVAWVGGAVVDLTRLEFDLLWHLVTHPGRTFRRSELLEAVWSSSPDWQVDSTVTEHVRRLRRKLEAAPELLDRIITVRGIGYRFEAARPAGPVPGDRALDLRRSSLDGAGAVADAVLVALPSGEIVAASPAAAGLLDIDRVEDLVGRNVLGLVAPSSLSSVATSRLCARAGRWQRPVVLDLVRDDGREAPVQAVSTQVSWRGRPATETVLWDLDGGRAELERVGRLHRDATSAVIVADALLHVRSLNPAGERLFGWCEAEVRDRPLCQVVPWERDDDLARQDVETFVREGRWEGELVQRRRDGARLTVHCAVTALVDADGQPIGTLWVSRPVELRRTTPPQPAGAAITAVEGAPMLRP